MKRFWCLLVAGLISGAVISCGGGGGGGGGGTPPPPPGPTAPPSTGTVKLNNESARASFHNMKAAFNNDGRGVVVWEERSGAGSRVLWAYFDGLNMQAGNELALSAWRPAVATNGTDFMLVWNNGRIRAATCSSSGTLGAPVAISDWNAADDLDIASNASGYAVAWRKYNAVAGEQRIFANLYSASSWTNEALVDTVSGDGDSPRIASNGSGYAVTWQKRTVVGQYDTYAAVNSGGTATWAAPALLEDQAGSAARPSIASNGSGYAVAWAQNDGLGNYDVYANIYSAGTWSSAGTLLDSSAQTVLNQNNIVIASSGSGYGVAWSQYDGSNCSAYANIYSGSSWTAAAVIDTSSNPVGLVAIASSAGGYAVAWQQDDGVDAGHIYANLASGGTWTVPVRLDSGAGSAQGPVAVPFPTGYAVAWQQDDASGNPNLFRTIYTPAGGWGPASDPLVQNIWRGSSMNPKMATNRSGVTLAVWAEYHGERTRLLGSINASGTWGTPFLIDSYASSDVAVATNGSSFMVLWYSFSQGFAGVAATCASDGTLGTPQRVGSTGLNYPSLASNGSGYAAVWSAWDGANESIFSNVYSSGSWSKDGAGIPTPWLLENGPLYAYRPVIASNGNGYSAAWLQNDGAAYSVYANLFTSGTWSTAGTLLEQASGQADYASIASNGAGYAVAWYQQEGVYYDIYANIYSAGSWSVGGTRLEDRDDYAYPPSIASNGSGYAVAWDQFDGANTSIFANVYSSGTWSTGGTLLENVDLIAFAPSIASNGSGYAVSWTQYDGSHNSVYANIYSSGTWSTGGTLLETNDGDADTTLIISNGNRYSVIWRQQDPADRIVYDIWARLGIF